MTTSITPTPWKGVVVDGGFWHKRLETNRKVTLPLEYELNKKNGVLDAYQWDWWDTAKGNPPWHIWVGDIAKWIEAASYSLAHHPDAQLEAQVQDAVDHILRGQKEDGYLYPNPLPRAGRWANLQENHELYEAGHDMEAAVAFYEATGRRDLLDAMCRYADLAGQHFGAGHGQCRGYDGHPEIELALVKLFRATGRRQYLDLAKFFVDVRGEKPNYFDGEREAAKTNGVFMRGWFKPGDDYKSCQAHAPLREQDDAAGHAVRAMYLYAGAADVAALTGDRDLLAACRRLWKSAVTKRMYVTGGIGSSPHGEAFSFDYDLPADTAYAETCAAIALVFFAQRMLQIDLDSQYSDVIERALYNGILSGISLDGRQFFYANPLWANPQSSHTSGFPLARQEWFGCACCPPNIARLLAGLGQFIFSQGKGLAAVHQYVNCSGELEVDGQKLTIRQRTQYPWKETVELSVEPQSPATFALALRIPDWCRAAKAKVNGRAVALGPITKKGYARIKRLWSPGDVVEITLPMPVERVRAHPAAWDACGKVALQRGPVVYCLEQADNGRDLSDIVLPRAAKLTAEFRKGFLGGAVVLRGKAMRRDPAAFKGKLYSTDSSKTKPVNITAVPYHLWANRTPGEMLVWIRGE